MRDHRARRNRGSSIDGREHSDPGIIDCGSRRIRNHNGKEAGDRATAEQTEKEAWEMKDREKMEKKIEIYEKALHRIMKIDESSVVRERTERCGYCDDSYELGVAMAIAEIALQEGGV